MLAACLAAAALALLCRWWLGDNGSGTVFLPRPDALEYAAAAQGIAQDGRYLLQIGPLRIPPRYAPGWPMALAPALRLGIAPTALWRLTGLCGAGLAVLLGLASGRLTSRTASPQRAAAPWLAAALAGILWACAPVAVASGSTLLSDKPVTLSAWITLSAVAVLLFEPAADARRTHCAAALGGVGFAATAAMRPITAALLAPSLALLCGSAFCVRGRRATLRDLAFFAAGALPVVGAVSALLVRSGLSPWKWTRYDLWVPVRYGELGHAFAARFAFSGSPDFSAAADGGRMPHLEVAARVLLGLPGLRPDQSAGLLWPVLGLVGLATLTWKFLRRRDAAVAATAAALLLWILVQAIVMGFYFYPAGRFYLPGLAAEATGAGWLAAQAMSAIARRARWAVVAIAALLPAAALQRAVDRGQAKYEPLPDIRERAAAWLARSDAERSGRVFKFDPLLAQALGLFGLDRTGNVHDWGRLPSTAQTGRLCQLGLLPAELCSDIEPNDPYAQSDRQPRMFQGPPPGAGQPAIEPRR